jgi:hypothetical protein
MEGTVFVVTPTMKKASATNRPKKKTSELPFFSSGATYIFKIALNHLLKSTSRKDARTTKKSFVNC